MNLNEPGVHREVGACGFLGAVLVVDFSLVIKLTHCKEHMTSELQNLQQPDATEGTYCPILCAVSVF